MALDPLVRTRIEDAYHRIDAEGRFPSPEKLAGYYATFRDRFGPQVLANLDGEELLRVMHGRTPSRTSLAYWLEFKGDDEFPAIFGSISGGSALKFGLFQRAETGEWVTGSPQKMQTITPQQAIDIARRQRDQLLAGVRLLDALPLNATDDQYRALQEAMDRDAREVSNLAWGHKYFSLLFPDKLDDYHSPVWQRFHLIRLLIPPPDGAGDGRYAVAGQFVAVAGELGILMNRLTAALNATVRDPYTYWRIGTTEGADGENHWPTMRDREIASIGWPNLGDLSWVTRDQQSKEKLRALIAEHYPGSPQVVGKAAQQVFNFVVGVAVGDIVLAANGMKALGIGRVKGAYRYDASQGFAHFREVEWLHLSEGHWTLPQSREGLLTSVYRMSNAENLIAVERQVLCAAPPSPGPKPIVTPGTLDGWPARIAAALEYKGQVILYGPPGTGKTHWAEITARELAARAVYGKAFAGLSADEIRYVTARLVRICTFHPAYGYEDFMEGYRPFDADGQMVFHLRDGIFKALCRGARAHPNHPHYLIIDEINRGDIPRVFGELLTILEKNKRGLAVLLPISGEPFAVPPNVYLIGTMNTADRSIALVDAALRRRFGAIEMMPDSRVLGSAAVRGIPLGPWLDKLNERIRAHVGRDARNLQIGHAYLLDPQGRPISDMAVFTRVVREELIPLLEEYTYENYATLAEILGQSVVDVRTQRIREELFEAGRVDDLVRALLEPSSEITASLRAVESDAQEAEEAGDDEVEGGDDAAVEPTA